MSTGHIVSEGRAYERIWAITAGCPLFLIIGVRTDATMQGGSGGSDQLCGGRTTGWIVLAEADRLSVSVQTLTHLEPFEHEGELGEGLVFDGLGGAEGTR